MRRIAFSCLTKRIESCLEKIPEGAGTADVYDPQEETGIDRSLSWCNEPDHIGVTLRQNSQEFTSVTDLNIFRNQGSLAKINFRQQESRFSETIQKLDPVRFEGYPAELGIKKLGKVASTLNSTVKTIKESQHQRT